MNLFLAIQHKLYSLVGATLSGDGASRAVHAVRHPRPVPAAVRPSVPAARVGKIPMGLPLPGQPAPARPLRVLRVVEKGQPPATGRLVISGRMADVCAELDRLAAREAAA